MTKYDVHLGLTHVKVEANDATEALVKAFAALLPDPSLRAEVLNHRGEVVAASTISKISGN